MNVTELYRELKMNKDEFFATVQELGFDIGERAIKVDDAIALKIIEAIRQKRKKENKKSIFGEEKKEQRAEIAEDADALSLPDKITVNQFAERLGKRVPDVIAILMQNGIMATINETLDYETAAIIAEDLGYRPQLSLQGSDVDNPDERAGKIGEVIAAEGAENLQDRPPVVVIMGHVDHGKTTLLDTIRDTSVTETESGGITQHIGAYQVEKKGKNITFIDTPGHEAFTTMRSRGARVADIAILVVAADDGVKPQTIESIHIMQEAEIPFIVAINKIDKPEADIDRSKKELSELNVIPEDYGGDVICVPVSAKQGTGIDDLLETILLVAEVNKDEILANPEGQTVGSIIESHVDKNIGPVSTVLVQNGTLRVGDIIQIGTIPGRVRSLKAWNGEELKEAGPSVPAQVLGLKQAPTVGDILEVASDKKALKQKIKKYDSVKFLKKAGISGDDSEKTKLRIVLRADKLGSLEAIIQSLQDITHKEVGIDIMQKGLGSITENDVTLAAAADALVLGFHVHASQQAQQIAGDEEVDVKTFTIIYELIDYAKLKLEKLLRKETVFEKIGSLKLLAVFRTEQTYNICGGRVQDGVVRVNAPVKIIRDGKMIGEGIIEQLEQDKQKQSEVGKAKECGMKLRTETTVQVDDILEIYQAQEKERTLED